MKHLDKELSAFLDGECRRPERVEAHLAQCPRCAARLQELQQVSQAIHALRTPQPRPGFVTRVLARVGEPQRRSRGHMIRWLPVAAAACAIIVFVALAVLRPTALDRRAANEDRITDLLAQRLDLVAMLESSSDLFQYPELDMPEVTEEVVAELANADWATGLDDLTPPDDFENTIMSLNPTERALFRELLQEYQEEV